MNKLTYWRTKRGLTIRQLSEKSGGISSSTISKIENEAIQPRTLTLSKLAEALEIDLTELIGQPIIPAQAYRPEPEELEELLARIEEDERDEGELLTTEQVRERLAAFKAERRRNRASA